MTGIGWVTALGTGVEQVWSALCAGRSGVTAIQRFDTTGIGVGIGAEIAGFDCAGYLDGRQSRVMDRFVQFAVVAAFDALADAGLKIGRDVPAERVGAIIGSGAGGQATTERQAVLLHSRGPREVTPYYLPMMLINMAAAQVAMQTGLHGPTSATATACAAGANAVGDAFRQIQRGDADVVLAGGTDASLHPLGVVGFARSRALSRRAGEPASACRPFDRTRDGFVLGEGAAVLVLEELASAVARDARVYCELVGYGCSTDAYHVTTPDPSGRGAAAAMRAALADAGLPRESVGYVNAHGTATRLGDAAEATALHTVFGDDQPAVSSTKAATGHMLGAAGAVEAAIAALGVARGVLPPTLNLTRPDPACDLDHVRGTARHTPVEAAMSNSFAFGGHNVALLFRADGA